MEVMERTTQKHLGRYSHGTPNGSDGEDTIETPGASLTWNPQWKRWRGHHRNTWGVTHMEPRMEVMERTTQKHLGHHSHGTPNGSDGEDSIETPGASLTWNPQWKRWRGHHRNTWGVIHMEPRMETMARTA